MQFPIYQVPYLGNGMVIALDAVIHVLISHGVAIGAFAMVAVCDHMASRSPDAMGDAWEHLAKRLLHFTVLATTIGGAVTGAGIWFVTGTLAPRAIASMLRVFFWPWFIEWIVFVLEVIGLLAFNAVWDRLRARRGLRMRLALAYLGLAFASALLISGILAFMLTPGAWPANRRFTSAFLNPTFVPQLGFRLSFALALGAAIGLLFAVFGTVDPLVRRRALRGFGLWLVGSVAVSAVFAAFYHAFVPRAFLWRIGFSVLTSHLSRWPEVLTAGNAVALALILVTGLVAIAHRHRATRVLAPMSLLLCFALVAEFERIREFVRGPYLMPGYMYANSTLLQERPLLTDSGLLTHMPWYEGGAPEVDARTAGAAVFAQGCSSCHTIGGLNDIRDRVSGRSVDGLEVIVGHLDELSSFMPPFSGTPDEAHALALFLHALACDRVRFDSRSRMMPHPEEP